MQNVIFFIFSLTSEATEESIITPSTEMEGVWRRATGLRITLWCYTKEVSECVACWPHGASEKYIFVPIYCSVQVFYFLCYIIQYYSFLYSFRGSYTYYEASSKQDLVFHLSYETLNDYLSGICVSSKLMEIQKARHFTLWHFIPTSHQAQRISTFIKARQSHSSLEVRLWSFAI